MESLYKHRSGNFSGIYTDIDSAISLWGYQTFVDHKTRVKGSLDGTIRLYKIRIQNPKMNSGKSGGFRLIYGVSFDSNTVCLLYIYTKRGATTAVEGDLSLSQYNDLINEFAIALASNNLRQYPINVEPIKPVGEFSR